MIRTLRKKFVIIIMALVGTVLVSVLGGYYASAWLDQRNLTYDSLSMKINQAQEFYATWGSAYDDMDLRRGPMGDTRMMVHVFEVDSDGTLHDGYETPPSLDLASLASVVRTAMEADDDTGWDSTAHVAWQRAQLDDDTWCVVVADTAFSDILLNNMLVRDLLITAAAMAALLAISIGLSTWVLRPVEQAWEQQRRFIADASHELKTPLAVIIANTQILARDAALPAQSRRWVDSTADESAHMKALVEELLELARTDETAAGTQGVMRQEPIDFSSMVESAALEFDAVAFERGTSIEEYVEQGIRVTGDPEWLGRLCKILVENACKYAQGDSPIVVRLARDGRRCALTVNNHGNTIASEDLPHVFDRFYRTDEARSRSAKTGGFGLGLAIAKGIATSHGGSIAAASDETSGTTFTVTLPLAG